MARKMLCGQASRLSSKYPHHQGHSAFTSAKDITVLGFIKVDLKSTIQIFSALQSSRSTFETSK